MIHHEPNTRCARCSKPIFRLPSVLARNEVSFCSRACINAARRDKKDNALAYVTESIDALSIPEMAEELQISRNALAYRIAIWRQNGLLTGHSRPYTRQPKNKLSSPYFRWKDFENDVIVGGNLYPDEVVVSGR